MNKFCSEHVGAKLLPSTSDPPPAIKVTPQCPAKVPKILLESENEGEEV